MLPSTIEPPKPDRTRIVLGLLIVVVALNIAATQYVAMKFAYHPALGSPLIGHIYPPWDWLVWKIQFEARAPQLFHTVSAGLFLSLTLGLLGLMLAGGRRAERHEGIHGTAHWASRMEIEATGLLGRERRPGSGVYVGGWQDARKRLHYLRHNGPEHVAAIAPTRSGKGVGLVVPTLLSWPYSVVVNDQKAELWNLTAAWRKSGAGNLVMKCKSMDLIGHS